MNLCFKAKATKYMRFVASVPMRETAGDVAPFRYLEKQGLMMDYIESLAEQNRNEPATHKLITDAKKVEYRGTTYYTFMSGKGAYTLYYVELLPIEDDKTFKWEADDDRDTYRSTVTKGNFTFDITFSAKADMAKIDVAYKGNGIDTHKLIGGVSNVTILACIDKWVERFMEDLRAIG